MKKDPKAKYYLTDHMDTDNKGESLEDSRDELGRLAHDPRAHHDPPDPPPPLPQHNLISVSSEQHFNFSKYH